MQWGMETSLFWQVPKSHCPLIWLSAPCHFANQPSPCQLHMEKQVLAGICLLPFLFHGQKWIWDKCSKIFHDVQLTKTPIELGCHFVQVRTALLRVKRILVFDGLWHFSPGWESLSSFWSLQFSFAVRSLRNPRSNSLASSDSSRCSSFLLDRKVFISGGKSTTFPRLNHRTHREGEGGLRKHRAHPITPWTSSAEVLLLESSLLVWPPVSLHEKSPQASQPRPADESHSYNLQIPENQGHYSTVL